MRITFLLSPVYQSVLFALLTRGRGWKERQALKALVLMLLRPSSFLLHPGYFGGWMHLTGAPDNLMNGCPAPFYGQGDYKTLTSWLQNCDQRCFQSPDHLCFIQTQGGGLCLENKQALPKDIAL